MDLNIARHGVIEVLQWNKVATPAITHYPRNHIFFVAYHEIEYMLNCIWLRFRIHARHRMF